MIFRRGSNSKQVANLQNLLYGSSWAYTTYLISIYILYTIQLCATCAAVSVIYARTKELSLSSVNQVMQKAWVGLYQVYAQVCCITQKIVRDMKLQNSVISSYFGRRLRGSPSRASDDVAVRIPLPRDPPIWTDPSYATGYRGYEKLNVCSRRRRGDEN